MQSVTSYQVGPFLIVEPHRVDLKEVDGTWVATFQPADVEDCDWGEGGTPEEAVADLAATLLEVIEHLNGLDDEDLGAGLLAYKRMVLSLPVSSTGWAEVAL